MDDGGGGETALTAAPAAAAVVRNKETMGFGVRPGPTETEWMKSGHKQTLWSAQEVLSDIQNCDNTWDLSWTGEWRGDKIRQSLSLCGVHPRKHIHQENIYPFNGPLCG